MLFLHGYLSSGDSFIYQKAYFERYFNVFTPDLKGFGKNQGMEWPYSLNDYLTEVKEYMYKNSIVYPNLIAHSFGGRIALKGASEDKNLFDKLVLTGCAGLKPKATIKKCFKRGVFLVAKRFIPKERLQAFYSKDYRELSPVMKESFKKIVSEHLDDRLPFIYNKTLLVFGKNDRETPIYMAKRLNSGIKNSSLLLFENAGHFCFIDESLKFNMEVREFLLSE